MRKINLSCLITFLSLTVFFSGCLPLEKKDLNVILISLDTVRYDHIDTGRGAKAYTPELRRFSQHSIVFENAFSTSSETLSSHLSVFTSRFPHELRVYGNEHKYDGRYKMIQHVFEESGYSTAAIISLGTLSSATGIKTGFQEFREDLFEEGIFYVPADKVTQEASRMIEEFKDRRFFLFVHYSDPHTPYAPPNVEGHFEITLDGKLIADFNPYRGSILRKNLSLSKGSHVIEFEVKRSFEDFHHFIIRRLNISEGCADDAQNLEFSEELYEGSYIMRNPLGHLNLNCEEEGTVKIFQIIPILKKKAALKYYREEVEYMDYFLGKFLRSLEESGLLKKTVIVIFGDHGEGQGERDNFFGHTRFLNRQFIHVPLIMHLPGIEDKRFASPVSLIGITPTVLECLGIGDKNFKLEESFLKEIKKGKFKDRTIFSFAFAPSAKTNKFSIIKWPYQTIFYLQQDKLKKREFYNFELSQSFNQSDALQEEVIRKTASHYHRIFQREFNQFRHIFSPSTSGPEITDKKMLEKLKALGYVDK